MEGKIKTFQELTRWEKAKYIFYSYLDKCLINLQTYIINPRFVGKELSMKYHAIKYKVLTYFDPPPLREKNEEVEVFLDRINPKYGLRYYELMYSKGLNISVEHLLPQLNQFYRTKKDREAARKCLFETRDRELRNIEGYHKFLIRDAIFNRQA